MPQVSKISIAPVKGFRLLHPDEVELTADGVLENRRFLLVDGDGRRLRSSLTPWPVRVVGAYDARAERLSMGFPDSTHVEGSALELGETVHPDFDGRTVEAKVVDGPWTERLSELAGHAVRIARPVHAGDVYVYPVTVVSEASVDRLGREVGDRVDGRRFRMLFTLEGCGPHEEDEWAGRGVRVGQAVIRVEGPVDRCAVTTRDPDTGERDLDTLRVIKEYRGLSRAGTIDFGVLATVEEPGRVRLGDAVEPL